VAVLKCCFDAWTHGHYLWFLTATMPLRKLLRTGTLRNQSHLRPDLSNLFKPSAVVMPERQLFLAQCRLFQKTWSIGVKPQCDM
jgi:hypothetical protein